MDAEQLKKDIGDKKNVEGKEGDCAYKISHILDGSLIKVSFSGPPESREKLEAMFKKILGPPFCSVNSPGIDLFSWTINSVVLSATG